MTTVDTIALRRAFGSFMTGVTVVTTRGSDGAPAGFTANSFTSVSLDPPLLLVCPGKVLSTYAVFESCTHFAVNILAEGQEEISNIFAGFRGDRFAQAPHHDDLNGVPLIDGSVAQFSCTTRDIVAAGDHCILIGLVHDFSHVEKPALGYVGGQYFSLGLEHAALEDAPGTAVYGAIIEWDDRVLLEKTPEGFRPLQIKRTQRGQPHQALREEFAARSITASLGQAYSVFDDRRRATHFSYFLATGDGPLPPGSLYPVPIEDLPALSYTTPAIAQMMTRFAREARTRSFALYLGDTHQGDVHSLSDGN